MREIVAWRVIDVAIAEDRKVDTNRPILAVDRRLLRLLLQWAASGGSAAAAAGWCVNEERFEIGARREAWDLEEIVRDDGATRFDRRPAKRLCEPRSVRTKLKDNRLAS